MSAERAADGLSNSTPVLRCSHVNLLVDDLVAARQFYGSVLGLPEVPRPGVAGTGAWFSAGNLQLHLSVVDAMPAKVSGGAPHIALQLRRAGFDDAVAALAGRGARVTRQPQSREQFGVDVRTAFCVDPAGNLIELTDI